MDREVPVEVLTRIPTHFPDGVEYLTPTCNICILLESYDIVEGPRLSKLRSITLDVTRNRPDDSIALAHWVLWLVRGVQNTSGWDTFQGLHFLEQDRKDDRIGPASGIFVPRDRIVEWCESVSHFRAFVFQSGSAERVLSSART